MLASGLACDCAIPEARSKQIAKHVELRDEGLRTGVRIPPAPPHQDPATCRRDPGTPASPLRVRVFSCTEVQRVPLTARGPRGSIPGEQGRSPALLLGSVLHRFPDVPMSRGGLPAWHLAIATPMPTAANSKFRRSTRTIGSESAVLALRKRRKRSVMLSWDWLLRRRS